MSLKRSFVTTTDEIVKEGINDMEKKSHVVKEDITPPIAKNNIDTVNKTEKPQAFKRKKINPSAINQKKLNRWMNKVLLKYLKQKTQ